MDPISSLRRVTYVSAGDLFTLANGVLGLLALTFILDDTRVGYTVAGGLLLLAVLADGVDGEAARRFGTKHHYGIYLDSIADTVSFCLAPAALIYMLFYDPGRGPALALLNSNLGWDPRFDLHNTLALATALMVGTMGMLRLARYTLRMEDANPYFGGLPTPAMCMLTLPLVFLGNPSPVLNEDGGKAFDVGLTSLMYCMMLMGASLLMVTELPYPKPRGRFTMAALVTMVMAGLAVLLQLREYDNTNVIWLAVFGLQASYVLGGPFITLQYLRRIALPPEQELIPYGRLANAEFSSEMDPDDTLEQDENGETR